MCAIVLFLASCKPTSYEGIFLNETDYNNDTVKKNDVEIKRLWPEVKKELISLNPQWNKKSEFIRYKDSGDIIGLDLSNRFLKHENNKTTIITEEAELTDISPLKKLPLIRLNLDGASVKDISPLSNMKLECLAISNTKVIDLSPLRNMPLTELYISNTAISDISPLKDAPLKVLYMHDTKVQDISPLAGKNIKFLNMLNTPAESVKVKPTDPLN